MFTSLQDDDSGEEGMQSSEDGDRNEEETDQNNNEDETTPPKPFDRRRDIPFQAANFVMEKEEAEGLFVLDYFKLIWTDKLRHLVVEQTNLNI